MKYYGWGGGGGGGGERVLTTYDTDLYMQNEKAMIRN